MPAPQRSATAAVAQRQQEADTRARDVGQYIARLAPEVQRSLPKGMDADRVVRIALTEIRKSVIEAGKRGDVTKSLAYCTQESFAGALLTASQLGLEPGVNGEAYLVPYQGECTLIVGYQGLVKLFYNSPLAKQIDCDTVCERDRFDYQKGTNPYLNHTRALGDRGPVIAYYACATLTTGAVSFVVLTPDEVKALRNGKEGPSGRIPDPERWMERKTVVRQLAKLLPKSTVLNQALDVDEHGGHELYRDRVQDNPALPNSGRPALEQQGEPARVVVPPDGGPAYNPQTGEAVTVDVLDPPPYDPADEPALWRDQGGAQ
jgi:recombination protein RecT